MRGKRAWRRDRKILLCTCAECKDEDCEDPDTGEAIKGKYLSRNGYYDHLEKERARRLAAVGSQPTASHQSHPQPASHSPGVAQGDANTPSPENTPQTQQGRPPKALRNAKRSEDRDLTYIQSLSDALDRRREQLQEEHQDLVFCEPPHPFSQLPEGRTQELNSGILELVIGEPHNTALLDYEQWLAETFVKLEPLAISDSPNVALNATLARYDFGEAVVEVERWKVAEWTQQRERAHQELSKPMYGQPGDRFTTNTEPYLKPAIRHFHPILLLCYLLVAVVHLLCGVSIIRCNWLLNTLQDILSLTSEIFSSPDTAPHPMLENIISAIPADTRTVVNHLAIDPKTKPFVCCPSCFACYPLDKYPDRCTAASHTGTCDAELRKTRMIHGRVRSFPTRLYVYHDFKDWFARLLCRPGMEEIMDKTLIEALEDGTTDPIGDFYDTDTLRKLNGPDKKPFITRDTREGRYVFSICMDGFMPTGKGGSASVSVGAIYLACMNLPASIRYREENLYLCAIIPGPTHPSQEMINPLLKSVVDDFLDLWHHGARYSHTPRFPMGKLVRCVIGPLVSDMLAARQMAGFSGHGSDRFCSFCLLSRDHIDNLDWWDWPLRSWDKQRAAAERWRDTEDPEERARIMREEGIRWSELFRLPYWNPLIFTAIDPMHALFLGLLHRHCENVWGMNSLYKDGLEGRANDPAKFRPADYEMQEAYLVLREGTDADLEALPKEVLGLMCKELKLRFAGRKGKLCSRLRSYRREKGYPRHRSVAPRADEVVSLYARSRGKPGSCWTPLQDFQLSAALKALESSKSDILRDFKLPVLRRMYTEKFGEQTGQYANLTKAELLNKLDDYIKVHNSDHPSSDCPKLNESANDDRVPTSWEVDYALITVEYGSKSDLKKFRPEVLAEACAVKSQNDPNVFKKQSKTQLLETLSRYRPDHGKNRSAMTAIAVNEYGIATGETALVHAEDIFGHGSKTALRKLDHSLLRALCVSKLLYSNERAKGVSKKNAVIELERQWSASGITDEKGKVLSSRNTRTRILGEDRLQLIWAEMQEIMLPSEVSPVPRRIGAPGQGTISADEWRTFCTIHLVVTLVYLWGSLPDTTRESQILRNFMDLITVVKIASSRSITRRAIWDMQRAMHDYLNGILNLFPGATIGPYQHMCLGHLPAVLANLGPSHAIWCYAFERANFVLQRIKTNSRIDDLSVTLLRRFCGRQNLRALFSYLPERLKGFVISFKKAFESNSRGTLFSDLQLVDDELRHILGEGDAADDLRPGKSYYLSLEVFESLQACDAGANRRVMSRRVVDYEGIRYRPCSVSPRDSYIVFRTEEQADWRAGQIRETFTQQDSGNNTGRSWLVVDEYLPLSPEDQPLDPYRKFPIAGGRLFYMTFKPKPLVLAPDDIICHSTMLKRMLPSKCTECVHILPLDKALRMH